MIKPNSKQMVILFFMVSLGMWLKMLMLMSMFLQIYYSKNIFSEYTSFFFNNNQLSDFNTLLHNF